MLESNTLALAKPRVVVGLSGGIDSTAATLLLTRQGYEVVGVTLKLWEYQNPESSSKCCTPEDVRDARLVAFAMQIPFYVRDHSDAFKREVIDYFVNTYAAGKTPNPCAVCNDKIKFHLLDLLAADIDADWIGTGHYAQVSYDPGSGQYQLRRGVDPSRDQSYFLFRLNQGKLKKLIFPLGKLHKTEVRELLREARLGKPDKAESRELCFVEQGRYAEFITERMKSPAPTGRIVNASGETLGEHQGLYHYTVGQRQGLGIASREPGEPYYVAELKPATQEVVLGKRTELMKKNCRVTEVSWISDSDRPQEVEVQLRYRGTPIPTKLEQLNQTEFLADFKGRAEIPSPGQAAVFYDGDRVLGGGWIN